MTDGKGIPIAIGNILEANNNDLYNITPEFGTMIKELNDKKMYVQNSILNIDKGEALFGFCSNLIKNLNEFI